MIRESSVNLPLLIDYYSTAFGYVLDEQDTIWFKDTSNGSLKPRNEKIIESRELKRIQQAFLITYRSLMNQESIERWSYPSCSVSSFIFYYKQLVIF